MSSSDDHMEEDEEEEEEEEDEVELTPTNDVKENPTFKNVSDDLKEFAEMTGFSPPKLLAAKNAEGEKTREENEEEEEDETLFESFQHELIDLQEQFKRDVLSLHEVESKFTAWQRRPELPAAEERRRRELEGMRAEWSRLQRLAALRTRKETQLWGRIRGLTRRMRRKEGSTSQSTSSDSQEL